MERVARRPTTSAQVFMLIYGSCMGLYFFVLIRKEGEINRLAEGLWDIKGYKLHPGNVVNEQIDSKGPADTVAGRKENIDTVLKKKKRRRVVKQKE